MTPLTQSQQQEDMDRVRLAFDMAGVRAYAEVDALRARLAGPADADLAGATARLSRYASAWLESSDESIAFFHGDARVLSVSEAEVAADLRTILHALTAKQSALSESRRELDALADDRNRWHDLAEQANGQRAAAVAINVDLGKELDRTLDDLTAARGEIARLREACIRKKGVDVLKCAICDKTNIVWHEGTSRTVAEVQHDSECALAAKGGA